MTYDRDWITARIPHQGDMCLLDGVESWDATHIRCRAASHRAPDNPLRAGGRLGAAAGIEYAAQAMALHGALLAPPEGEAPRAGFLASVRGVELLVDRLDDVAEDLVVEAERLSGEGNSVLYAFSVSADGRVLLRGRAAVVLDAGAFQSSSATLKS
jgi:predicted hotdog family 3-hydroxylacyl-ACP dehydratase